MSLKKKSFYLVFLFLIVVSYFSFKKIFINETKIDAFLNMQNKKTSPCRNFVEGDKYLKSKRQFFSKTFVKLTHLMEEPIDLVFQDIKGEWIDLSCFRDKKVILLNFWASWCAPCIEELPSLSKLADQYQKDIFVVAVSFEALETIQSFLKQAFSDLSPHFRVAHLSQEEKEFYFPEDKLPVTYIFNKQGLLSWKEMGAKDWYDKDIVKQILALP